MQLAVDSWYSFFDDEQGKEKQYEEKKIPSHTKSRFYPDFVPTLLSKSNQGNIYGPFPSTVLDKERDSSCIKEQNLIIGNNVLLVLDDVFSFEEVDKVLDLCSVCGYDDLSELYPREYRNNDRVMVEDGQFVDIIYERIKPIVEKFVIKSEEMKQSFESLHEIERYPIGLNKRMRICVYSKGGIFGGHQDSYVAFGNMRSRFTCMAYLNDIDVKDGGGTRFFGKDQSLPFSFFTSQGHVDVQPKLGRVVIFNHKIFHEGLKLHGDVKHILRSDILFREASLSDYSNNSAIMMHGASEGLKTPDSKS